jgi:hypothetical protein
MRATGFTTLLIFATAAGASSLHAQSKKEAGAASSGSEVRYFTSLGGMDDQADSILKETRTAGKVTAATLDVCYPVPGNSDRRDRFIAALTVNGQKLTGTTESLDGKQPVTVGLTRKPTPTGVTFDGKITIGSKTSNISSADNIDVSEKEFMDGQETDDPIIQSPSDFATASPEAVAVRLKPESVTAFVNSLRGQTVEISLTSLLPTCTELRKGEQIIRMNIDPEKAPDFIAKMKNTSGIIAAGWTSGQFDMDRTIRFSATGWRDGSKLNRDKLAATLSAVIAKTLSATALTSQWNDDNGVLKLAFRRPNASLPGLGLTQTIEFSALAASDKAGNGDKLLLWIGYPAMTTTDETAGTKLKFSDASDSGTDDSAPVDDGDALAAVARELKAERWDSEESSWK